MLDTTWTNYVTMYFHIFWFKRISVLRKAYTHIYMLTEKSFNLFEIVFILIFEPLKRPNFVFNYIICAYNHICAYNYT